MRSGSTGASGSSWGRGVIEQAADDAIEALELPRHAGDDLLIRAPAAQHLQVRPGGAERIADLVGATPAARRPILASFSERTSWLCGVAQRSVMRFSVRRALRNRGCCVRRAGSEVAIGDASAVSITRARGRRTRRVTSDRP